MKKVVKKKMGIISIGIIGFVIGFFFILLLLSGVFQKAHYLEPWGKEYYKKWEDPRIQLSAHGLLAANGHNMQPWKIVLDESNQMNFYVYADSSRMSEEADPDARQFMISQGTFLEYIYIAGQKLGYEVAFTFFPMGPYNEEELEHSMDTKPVAKISLRKNTPIETSLYDAIFLPDTNRSAYLQDSLTEKQMDTLKGVFKETNDISLEVFQDKENRKKLADYALDGTMIEAGVTRVMEEAEGIFRGNEFSKNQYRYGFSVEGQGTTGIMKHVLQGLVTIFPSMNQGKSAADTMVKATKASVKQTPAYAMIITTDNTRESQIQTGMLYSKMILEAHQMGLVMQPLSQVLEEYPEMEPAYHAIHSDYAPNGETIQMLLRIGQSEQVAPLSMRRDISDLVE